MHGYEAVYQVEKTREKADKKTETKESFFDGIKHALEGIRIIVTNPYVLGVFSLSLFYDMVISVLILLLLQVLMQSLQHLVAWHSFTQNTFSQCTLLDY